MYFVYITTNPSKKVLYTGVTKNLFHRLLDHFNNRGDSKTSAGRYSSYNLIYYEEFKNISNAIYREKEIKNRPRKWKEELIATENPS